ncbi:toxin-antitoxin system YwqK family antitoxin [Salinactinospora qingdaonensis]|uniref:MORN repeat variant n=1 Tax=Salinactinospora qingdaonensis TaxID=702744 RepID=A0ABP7FW89_9ACTN
MNRVDAEDVDFKEDGTPTYQGKTYTGEIVEYDEAENMASLTTYRNGHEEGPSLEWYSDGTPLAEGTVAFGKGAIGPWRRWHPNGKLAREKVFDDEGRTLSIHEWDKEGNLIKEKILNKP